MKSLIDKKKFNLKKKALKNKYLYTQLNFIGGLIEFMKGLIARNVDF